MSSRPCFVVSVDAPSDSGKSTLVGGLLNTLSGLRVVGLPCYVDAAGGDAYVPPDRALSAEQQLAQFRFFLDLERRRRSRLRIEGDEVEVLLLDRSIHSLLAHSLAEQLLGGPPTFDACVALAKGDPHVLWPDLVFFLDVSDAKRAERVEPGDQPKWFADASFNRALCHYFAEDVGELGDRLVVLDGDPAASVVLADAEARLRERLARIPPTG